MGKVIDRKSGEDLLKKGENKINSSSKTENSSSKSVNSSSKSANSSLSEPQGHGRKAAENRAKNLRKKISKIKLLLENNSELTAGQKKMVANLPDFEKELESINMKLKSKIYFEHFNK